MSERLYVVVSGPPASGKSTLAPQLAVHYGLPLLAKDTIKGALMAVALPATVEESRVLGRQAVLAMLAVAAQAPRGAVLESVFHRTRALPELAALPGRVVEVFCRCDPDVALARYAARASSRHAGHFDREREIDELRNAEVTEPVAGGWPVLEVSTDEPVELGLLVQRLDVARSS